jgi:multiple sugar transport system ATP-binding protein
MGKIVLKSVRKSFGEVDVIPSIDLSIEDGEFVVFVGPSGCGKSTLLRLIAGLEDVTSGHISIDGVDATDLPPAKRKLAMVFQSYALYPHMTVRKNIMFPLKMAGMEIGAATKRADDAAKVLNLTSYMERCPVVSGSVWRLAERLFGNPKPSCLMSRCRTLTQRSASTCGRKSPNCTSS